MAQSNPRWTTGKRLTGLVSGPGVTGTGNAKVSVPVQGLEVEAQVSDRHNSWPFRSSPHGESRIRRGPRAGAPCGPSGLSATGKEATRAPHSYTHSENLQVLSCQPLHPPISNLHLIGLQTWTSPILPHPFRLKTAFRIPPSPCLRI